MSEKIVHFSIGPVQDFIADARRTRDLWAGSFLLSWLAGQAINALPKGSCVVFPEVANDQLLAAIRASQEGAPVSSAPYIGTLPNRFKARGAGVSGAVCAARVQNEWESVAKAVWDQFVCHAEPLGKETKRIWDRQVESFWDITWVEGDEPADCSDCTWLDLRKNWRTHYPVDVKDSEGGDLCRLMGRYQEISGYDRVGGKVLQDAFYAALRSQKYMHPTTREPRELGFLNIGKTERLSAIALIKRLFPLLDNIESVIGWRPGGGNVNVINWPSVSYIAAVPWLKAVSRSAEEAGDTYAEAARSALQDDYRGEIETKLFGLAAKPFISLDGHLLHEDGIRSWPDDGFRGAVNAGARAELLGDYRTLTKAVGNTAPSEFYALLLMDGDSVGTRIAKCPNLVKTGLAFFAEEVVAYFDTAIGDKNPANGVLIYAGGDDVLALLPVDTAILAAKRMRATYRNAFNKALAVPGEREKDAGEFTLSGAVVFAQYRIPFRSVLQKAHEYLDDVAKDGNGRDSLAIAVMKPGGVALEWVSCWEGAIDPVTTLESIAQDRPAFSTGLLHNLQERYGPLFSVPEKESGKDWRPFSLGDVELMRPIIKAEYLKQGSKCSEKELAARIDTDVEKLMTVGTALTKKTGQIASGRGFNFEGPLLADFLATEARWDVKTTPQEGGGEI